MKRIKYQVVIDGHDCGVIEAHTRILALAYVEQHMAHAGSIIVLKKVTK